MAWTDEYREIVEFYWWEPQVLGRSKNNYHRFGSADDMWQSVSQKEVALNHVLNIFFALFPLEKLPFGLTAEAKVLSSRELEALQRKQKNATQPDFFIVDVKENVAIELKTGSKSSLAQVKKYQSFHEAIDKHKSFRLVMLSPYENGDKLFGNDAEAACCSYVSFDEFACSLRNIRPENSTEQKLLEGVIAYIEEYFGKYLSEVV